MVKKNFTEKISGERIYLRLLQLDNVSEQYCAWLNDPEVTQFLLTKKTTIKELQEYVSKRIEDPNCLFYGIFLKENNLHIGNVKLEPIDWKKKHAIVGIMIGDKQWQGKGIGIETLKLLNNYCFEKLGFTEVELGVQADNVRAIIAYLKSGFIVKKTKKIKEDGKTRTDLIMFCQKVLFSAFVHSPFLLSCIGD